MAPSSFTSRSKLPISAIVDDTEKGEADDTQGVEADEEGVEKVAVDDEGVEKVGVEDEGVAQSAVVDDEDCEKGVASCGNKECNAGTLPR